MSDAEGSDDAFFFAAAFFFAMMLVHQSPQLVCVDYNKSGFVECPRLKRIQ
eukprot:m.112025 g.112025  ORF g.112025 m.112025 type:complete len:51 (-) comp13468_c0_seq16:218-370(-)